LPGSCITVPLHQPPTVPGQRDVRPVNSSMHAIGTGQHVPLILVTGDRPAHRSNHRSRGVEAGEALDSMEMAPVFRAFGNRHAGPAIPDEPLVHRSLALLAHAEQLGRRQARREPLHPETAWHTDPGRWHRHERRHNVAAPAEAMTALLGCTAHTPPHHVRVATPLVEFVIAILCLPANAPRIGHLLQLAIPPPRRHWQGDISSATSGHRQLASRPLAVCPP
jgi:hypothetical protein